MTFSKYIFGYFQTVKGVDTTTLEQKVLKF